MNNPYSIQTLLTEGDWVIQTIALLLLIMSVSSWYIIMTRGIQLIRIKKNARHVEKFWHTHSFEEGLSHLKQSNNPIFLHLALEAQAAVEQHDTNLADLQAQIHLGDWLNETLQAAIDDAAEKLHSGLSMLASVGSTTPFIGLFGTVWGIYHALVKISLSGQASLDKIAGPVGEALIMTALGLAVAIPAVLGYNTLTRGNKNLRSKLNRFARQLHGYFLTGSPSRQQTTALKEINR
jgi:biopolymer transport protein ExbB